MYEPKHKKYDDHYRYKKLLGIGSCGSVVKSISKSDFQAYAVKLFEMRSLDLQNISYEAEAMMRAKSDYTVELLDHFYDEQQQKYALVMPYYNKGNLTSFMKKEWNRIDILCFLFQICQAFLSFDKKGACWHLDLKPDNILVKAEGEYLICDFGCAKLVDNINHSKFLQMSINRGVGTAQYAAPELLLDIRGSRYSDMWSLGIILYKILYGGKHPFKERADQRNNIVKYIKNQGYKIEFENKPGFEDVIQLCRGMLEPEKRLQWDELKKKIYESLGLPLQVQMVTDIQKFISYAQNVSRISMGLVYYLQKNESRLQKFSFKSEAQKIISSIKSFISILYREVEQTIENKNFNKKILKSEITSFYIFPQTQANYTFQEKQRLEHLRNTAQAFSWKEYKEHENVNYYNMKMNFESDVEEFLAAFKAKGLDKLNLNPIYEWEKIQRICSFIGKSNHEKSPGLDFGDRNTIQQFANKLIYQ